MVSHTIKLVDSTDRGLVDMLGMSLYLRCLKFHFYTDKKNICFGRQFQEPREIFWCEWDMSYYLLSFVTLK